MKKALIIFSCIIFIFPDISHAQHSQTNAIQNKVAIDFLKEQLKEGDYKADLMTGSQNNERRVALTIKMQEAIKKNFDWYVNFVKDAPNGYPTKYDKKLGLTEEEFKELTSLLNNYHMSSEKTFKIRIERNDSLILFNTYGQLPELDQFKINLNDGTINFNEYEFMFMDAPSYDSADNRIGSKIKSYRWSYEFPEKIDVNNIAKYLNEEVKLYRFILGKLIPSGKIYLSINGVEAEEGTKIVEFVFPLFLERL